MRSLKGEDLVKAGKEETFWVGVRWILVVCVCVFFPRGFWDDVGFVFGIVGQFEPLREGYCLLFLLFFRASGRQTTAVGKAG